MGKMTGDYFCGLNCSYRNGPKHLNGFPAHSKIVELHRTFAAPTQTPKLASRSYQDLRILRSWTVAEHTLRMNRGLACHFFTARSVGVPRQARADKGL